MEYEHGTHGDHHGHAGHAGHSSPSATAAHTAHANTGHHAPASWRMAAQATLHCLTGCAIGEILGMVIGTAFGWNNTSTMVLAIVLAFLFGYALTMRGVLKAGLPLAAAVTTALAADTVSITVMEIVDNAVILAVPGAMDAHLDTVMFWATLAFSLVVAFVLTTPVNKWMIGRGKGHAVVHSLHGHH
ncbi:DUF4396 domain-containing protein [Nocardia sp. CA-107356]|uniref:DUF4396 domain-containing protein n=1 Tax=Nocardia sp. CA-107356 TaxID=3239972 RepID=UPI003D8C05C8